MSWPLVDLFFAASFREQKKKEFFAEIFAILLANKNIKTRTSFFAKDTYKNFFERDAASIDLITFKI